MPDLFVAGWKFDGIEYGSKEHWDEVTRRKYKVLLLLLLLLQLLLLLLYYYYYSTKTRRKYKVVHLYLYSCVQLRRYSWAITVIHTDSNTTTTITTTTIRTTLSLVDRCYYSY